MNTTNDSSSRARLLRSFPDLLLDQILNHMFSGVTVIDRDGVVLLVNERTLDMFGYREDELVGQNVTILMEPGDAARHTAGLARYVRTRQPRLIGIGREVWGRTKAGGRIPLHLTVSEFWLSGHNYFVGFMRDISAERWANDLLEQTRHRFEFAFDNALQATCLGDADGNILEANKRFADLVGHSIEDLRRNQWTSLVHPDDLGPVLRALDAMDPDLSPKFDTEVRVLPQDGYVNWVEFKARFAPADDKNLAPIIVQLEDITQRRVTMHSLRDAQERLRTAFETSLIGQGIVDMTGQVIAVNPAFAQLMGGPEDSLIGANIESFTHPDYRATVRTAGALLASGQESSWRGELRFITADGRQIWVSAVLTASSSAEGQPIQFLAQSVDITAEKELLAALTRSNTDLQRYAHLASHDLQAPLRNLSSYTELLFASLDPSLLTDDQLALMDHMGHATRDMQQLVRDMLELCRVDIASRGEPVFTPVESAFRDALKRLQSDIAGADADVTLIDNSQDALVALPAGQLTTLLQNLIHNSLRFRSDQRRLRVVVTCQPVELGTVTIEVADNGSGIAPEIQQLVFEMYRTGPDSDGTGLGLALVKRIVESSGGEIKLTSDGWSGTTFTISLPIQPTTDH
ncbi:MAG: PAS domain S-box protein [Candidatus Nanopelagicales bacterium]|nr:PAS domain S-box protein [Candidatus Nanopelagicales bacterium]